MLKELKKIFSTLVIYQNNHAEIPENYQWFITSNQDIIGIDTQELSSRDTALLSTFLSPYSITIPKPTSQEQLWKSRLQENDNAEVVSPFRLVYFKITENQMKPLQFKEAIQDFYAKSVPIIWENQYEGIIIEELSDLSEEFISYEQIINTLMSDLYVNIRFYVGPILDNLTHVKQLYATFITNSEQAFSYFEKPVITYMDAIIHGFIDRVDTPFRDEVIMVIFKDLVTDKDLLHTLQTFIQSNLNTSVAAKALHMHRNSLQYRLDKFRERTGIDIRQFDQAIIVYLGLLSIMHRD
ncbi:PucR family transcriptional regulator [Oceanobacillus chungangensis]|nr:helix-turn-helix domain-containing protein [Oceanobacillus chungangensis]